MVACKRRYIGWSLKPTYCRKCSCDSFLFLPPWWAIQEAVLYIFLAVIKVFFSQLKWDLSRSFSAWNINSAILQRREASEIGAHTELNNFRNQSYPVTNFSFYFTYLILFFFYQSHKNWSPTDLSDHCGLSLVEVCNLPNCLDVIMQI